jgi:hypothetical protein
MKTHSNKLSSALVINSVSLLVILSAAKDLSCQ